MAWHCLSWLIFGCFAAASCANEPPRPLHAFALAGAGAGDADYVDLATIRKADYGDRLVWRLRVHDHGEGTTYSLFEDEILCRYRQLTLRYGADFTRDGSLIEEGGGDGAIAPIVPGTLADAVFGYVCAHAIPPATLFSNPDEAVEAGEALLAQSRRNAPEAPKTPPYP